jgi:GT2 family glycosyltransferase
MTETPLVTAILPSWNAAGFIPATLASLDAQTYPAIEVLVGDDASSDATPDILREWAATRPHVRLVLRDRNLGWVGNCNDLMARARGDYMFFAFHDDELDADYVETLVQALHGRRDAILSYGHLRWTEADGTMSILTGRKTGVQATALARARDMILGSWQWHVPIHGLFRASAFPRIGGLKLNDAGEFSADFPWLLHMMLLGRFVVVRRPICTKHRRGGTLARSWKRDDAAHIARDRAARREVWASPIPVWQKLVLDLMIRLKRRGRSQARAAPRSIPAPPFAPPTSAGRPGVTGTLQATPAPPGIRRSGSDAPGRIADIPPGSGPPP